MNRKVVSIALAVLLMGLVVLPGCVSQTELDECKALVVEQNTTIEEQGSEIAELESQLEAKDVSIAELEEENATLQKEIEELKVEVSTPTTATAKIEISFDPSPVPCQNGKYSWSVFLKEVNGIGVKLQEIIMRVHGHRGTSWIRNWIDEDWLEDINYYLSPYGVVESRRFLPIEVPVTHVDFIVTGVDANGNEVRAEGRVDFIPKG